MSAITASFADEDLVTLSYELLDPSGEQRPYGFIQGGDGKLLVAAITGIVVIFGWVMGHMVWEHVQSKIIVNIVLFYC